MIESYINDGQLFRSCIRFFDMDSIEVSLEEGLLSEEEKETLQKKKTEKSLIRSKKSLICTKLTIKDFCLLDTHELQDITMVKGVFGQPLLSSNRSFISNLGVSLSYTNNTIGILLFDLRHPMGLDIELKTVEDAPFLRDFFTEDELKLIQMNKDILTKEMFFSAKESLSKILKTGLTSPLCIYEISNFKVTDTSIFLYFKNFTQYHTEVTNNEYEFRSITFPINSKKLKECIK
ncbi:4'-phosphopantetheinyl transferase family protein [Solibacillus merdavium]|uniref:4-phosphopantetheinyl transferase family protein n=1 Tax=Solibacillus merdavium TaxID=2762218 RepID=A0ABR8XMB5_9BACL|nr:4'-phosphopantetheinyl transferase superfamily protein [Solibacillus merdavium]MBD8033054.1 4-phosphopantetheinyl transferase family protein [Solibacillus merdavium]